MGRARHTLLGLLALLGPLGACARPAPAARPAGLVAAPATSLPRPAACTEVPPGAALQAALDQAADG